MAFESLHKKHERSAAPLVHITYDVECDDTIEKRELPFVLGVLADLSGLPAEPLPRLRDRKFIEVDRDNFDRVLEAARPRAAFTVPNVMGNDEAELNVELSFRGINDFAPDAVAMQVPILREALELRAKRLGEARQNPLSGLPSAPTSFSPVVEIDCLLSRQMDQIVHHSDFQKLEATWRGLWFLISQTKTSARLKIRVLNVDKKTLTRDSRLGTEFDQSFMFKKVYEEEYGTAGGLPYAVLIGDLYFGRDSEDIELLRWISQIAASCHAPFIASASAGMFALEDFELLANSRDLAKIFDWNGYAHWKSFRKEDHARFVGLVLPRILLRLPFGNENLPTERFHYEEQMGDHGHYLWGNSAFAFGVRIAEAFARFGWCMAIRGMEGGGLVQGLPVHEFLSEDGDIVLKCPTEIAITDRRQVELPRLGFIPLLHVKNTDNAVFLSVPSCFEPARFLDPDANASAALSADLRSVLTLSRFTHYLRCITRDKIGSFVSIETLSKFLNDWISHYVVFEDYGNLEIQAKFPLRSGRIDLEEVPGKPGAFRAKLEILPRFQFADNIQPLRTSVELLHGTRFR